MKILLAALVLLARVSAGLCQSRRVDYFLCRIAQKGISGRNEPPGKAKMLASGRATGSDCRYCRYFDR